MLTYLFNACVRLRTIPKCLETARRITLSKRDKVAEQVTSHRFILQLHKEAS